MGGTTSHLSEYPVKKTLFLFLLAAGCATTTTNPGTTNAPRPAPPAGCDSLQFDIVRGTLNGLKPAASQSEVKAALPCFTGDTEDGSAFNYGGGVFFLNHDFFFYTGRDFIEIRSDFKGSDTPQLLGADHATVRAQLGTAKGHGELPGMAFHATDYGCARLRYRGGAVVSLAAHAEPCDQVMSWYRD